MKKIVDVSLKTGKVMVFALLAAQYVFAIWWVIKNIIVIPDFAVASESFIYNKVSSFTGVGFWLIYLAQAVAMYLGIKELFPKNPWVVRFTITNPLIIQFVFALVPDVFCIAILLALLAPVLYGEKIRGRHVIFLFLFGMLSSLYFFAGIFVLFVLIMKQYIKRHKNALEQKNKKEKISNLLMVAQILLVIILILVSYKTRENENDYTDVQLGITKRFTIDENLPSNHSTLSVAKGVVMDTMSIVTTPFTYMQAIDQKMFTKNGWNYVNFTREAPKISKYYMELSERNMFLVLAITAITWMLTFAEQNHIINSKKTLFLLTCFGISILFTVTTKRGVDYRTGLFIIPIWYGLILTWFEQIQVFPNKEVTKKSCSLEQLN